MNASVLLDELRTAGIRLSHDGGDLVADVLVGGDLDPYRARILQHKPALLTDLRLREQIIAALDVEPKDFNRAEYERLTATYAAQKRSFV